MEGYRFRLVVVYFPHRRYSVAAVEEVYRDLSEIVAEARKAGRRVLLGGDFNAVVGQRRAGDSECHIGEYGLGERNDRGHLLLQWAVEEGFVLANTLYRKLPEKRWTHVNGGRKRQIDFVCCEVGDRRLLKNAEATADIGTGNDHHAVKVELYLQRRKVKKWKGRKKTSMVGWKPDSKEVYEKELGEALQEMLARERKSDVERTIQDRCKSIEDALATVAERCKKAEADVSEESRKGPSERLKEMIRERRGARASGAASREKVAELSKQIQRQVRRELRERKREKIAAILTEFRGLKHIADVRAHGVKRKLGCVVDRSGKLQSGREGVVEAFAEFYADLYSSRKNEGSDMVANLWVGVQEVPKVEVEEVEQQLKKMARRKAADGAGIVAEMLKDGGHTLYELLAEVFSDVLAARQDPPEYWKETRIKVLLKKGDAQCLDNYRPLSIIPILYKVFSRILDSRLRRFLSAEQSVDQAAYKPGFSCEDHLFTLTMLAEKSAEFQLPVWMAAVDFRKAFDSVEFESIWSSLEELNVPAQYTAVLKLLYAGQTARVVDEAESKPFKLGRGTKQGDPVSCVLFNSVVECVMRRLKKRWTSKGWGFDLGEGNPRRLQNLRFADDIILFGTSLLQASRMLDDLRQMCQEVGLSVHYGKTKFLSNLANRSGFFNSLKKVPIDGSDVEVLAVDGSIAYLGRCLCFQNFMDVELDHRIGRGWAKFGVYKGELCDRRYSLVHRIRLFNAVVTPTILYGCGSWTLSVGARRRLRAAQRRMIRKMLGVRRGRRAVAEEGEETERTARRERCRCAPPSGAAAGSSRR